MDNIIDKVLALKNVNIFHTIADHILADIAEIIKEVTIPEGEQFIKKGEIGDCMYILFKGSAKVHDGAFMLSKIGENKIVGELAILAPVLRTADVTALEDCVLFKIDREYFSELLEEESEISKGVMRALVERIIANNERKQDPSESML
jgi:CRP-like cAMP-binding protein